MIQPLTGHQKERTTKTDRNLNENQWEIQRIKKIIE